MKSDRLKAPKTVVELLIRSSFWRTLRRSSFEEKRDVPVRGKILLKKNVIILKENVISLQKKKKKTSFPEELLYGIL